MPAEQEILGHGIHERSRGRESQAAGSGSDGASPYQKNLENRACYRARSLFQSQVCLTFLMRDGCGAMYGGSSSTGNIPSDNMSVVILH